MTTVSSTISAGDTTLFGNRFNQSSVNVLNDSGTNHEEEMRTKLALNISFPSEVFFNGFEPSESLMIELERMMMVTNVVIPVIIAIILVFGLIGNALVVYVTIITKRTAKHPIHSLFVLNLAAADVLFLLVCAPYRVAINSMSAWRYGNFLCRVIPFLATGSMAASIYTICALAWMRFMALVMPFRFRRSRISTRKAGYFVIAAIWIASSILSLPTLIHYGVRETDIHNGQPILECQWKSDQSHLAYAIVKLVVTYILPLILVIVFYAVIGREVLCYMMHRNNSSNQCAALGGQKNTEKKECTKSTIVVLTLILAFLICWFPHLLETVFALAGVMTSGEEAKGSFILDSVSKCMSYAHACFNPFIYTFASPIFRHSLRVSFRRKFRQGKLVCKARKRTRTNTLSTRLTMRQSGNGIVARQLRNENSTAAHDELISTNRNALALSASDVCGIKTEQMHITTAFDHTSPRASQNTSPTTSQHGANGKRIAPPSLNEAEALLECDKANQPRTTAADIQKQPKEQESKTPLSEIAENQG